MTQAPINNNTRKVYNIIILDESGSMRAICDAALSGCNEVLLSIHNAAQKHTELEQWMQLVTFNSNRLQHLVPLCPAAGVQQIDNKLYLPDACTPLYDAIGQTLTQLMQVLAEQKEYRVEVTIITDGYENASREYSLKAVHDLINRLKQQSWEFTFIGANIDVDAVAKDLNINRKIHFSANDKETTEAFNLITREKLSFMSMLEENFDANLSDLDFKTTKENNDKS